MTAQAVDTEIRKIIEEQYARALSIVREKRAALDTLAAALIEHETIEGRHVAEILEFGEIRSPVHRDVPKPAAEKPGDKRPDTAEGSKVQDLPPGTAAATA
jgi:cell division protease FtsH